MIRERLGKKKKSGKRREAASSHSFSGWILYLVLCLCDISPHSHLSNVHMCGSVFAQGFLFQIRQLLGFFF